MNIKTIGGLTALVLVNGFLAGNLLLGDRGNPPVLDADVADGVVHGLWVHDAAIEDDQIVVLCWGR